MDDENDTGIVVLVCRPEKEIDLDVEIWCHWLSCLDLAVVVFDGRIVSKTVWSSDAFGFF